MTEAKPDDVLLLVGQVYAGLSEEEIDAVERIALDRSVWFEEPAQEVVMSEDPRYTINLDEAFGPLELVDVRALAGAVEDSWHNQTLCRVNDCVVRLGVMQGEFHWHHHDEEDEFFYVIDGRFLIDLEEGRTVELTPQQGFMVPRGVVHRTRAPERTVILMTEGAGVVPTGDAPEESYQGGPA